jgi:large subunit ribosomal protein L13
LTLHESARYPWLLLRFLVVGAPSKEPDAARMTRGRSGRWAARSAEFQSQLLTRQGKPVRTYSPKADDIQRQWHVIDASDVVLGRLATHAATLLRGKHKPIFAPHVDTGDFVIVINAGKIALTGNKRESKVAYRHSGYPGGLKRVPYSVLLDKRPEQAIEIAVRGMLPKNRIGRQMLTKLKVYAGPEHPHQAQQPTPFEIIQVAQ